MCTVKTIIKNNGHISEIDVRINEDSLKSILTPYYVVANLQSNVFLEFHYSEEIQYKDNIHTDEFFLEYGRLSGRVVSFQTRVKDISNSNWKYLRSAIKENIQYNSSSMNDTMLLGLIICKSIYTELLNMNFDV